MSALAGQYALVTGGSSGIGRGCVERFRAEGATVFVADINPSSSDEIQLDVTDSAAWTTLIADLPPLDIVMLNAGITTPDRASMDAAAIPLSDVTDAAFRTIVGVNLDGVFFGARAVIPGMTQRPGGHILVTASVAGLAGMAADIPYAATKHAVVGLVRSLGAALEPYGVCISALCPGFVNTPLVSAEAQEMIREMGLPIIQPADVAEGAMQALAARANGSQWMVWGDSITLLPVPDFGLAALDSID
jgi:NAD(P)-dependent dehydrogenase (short-subunit alcohol dehydrogenase family)